jgi:flagellar biosynthesis protein FlhG
MVATLPFQDSTPSDGFSAKILTFGGGKGGIGKSFLASSIATTLARRGSRVLLVDLDLGGANTHAWLGMPPARDHDLGAFLRKGGPELESLVLPGPTEGLHVIHGSTSHLGAPNLKFALKQKIITHLRRLPFEWILLDLGAGSSNNILDFFLLGTRGLVVVSPEKTSVENAYRFLRAALLRGIRHAAQAHGFLYQLKELDAEADTARSIPELLDRLAQADRQAERIVRATLRRLRAGLILNQVWSQDELRLASQMKLAVSRHLGLPLTFLGPVRHDESVIRALRKGRHPLEEILSHDGVRDDITAIVDRIIRDGEYPLAALGGH